MLITKAQPRMINDRTSPFLHYGAVMKSTPRLTALFRPQRRAAHEHTNKTKPTVHRFLIFSNQAARRAPCTDNLISNLVNWADLAWEC